MQKAATTYTTWTSVVQAADEVFEAQIICVVRVCGGGRVGADLVYRADADGEAGVLDSAGRKKNWEVLRERIALGPAHQPGAAHTQLGLWAGSRDPDSTSQWEVKWGMQRFRSCLVL